MAKFVKFYSQKQMVFAVLLTAALVSAAFVKFYEPSRAPSNAERQDAAAQIAQSATQDAALPPKMDGFTQDEIQNISVYEQFSESVVNITTEVMGFNWFLEPVAQDGGSGSGSIIDERGYVVTNSHVVKEANKIFVSLSDGTQYEANLIGMDADSDIAVLKFSPPAGVALKTIQFGDSANLKVGQKVIAIGNPFGFDRTLTTGVVSSVGRPIQNGRVIIRNMIQTDTAINPGNSGGPLFDSAGRMIGINTMIYSTSGSSAGIGFAVPVNTAKRVVAELIEHGAVRRGAIDANFVQMTAQIARYAGLSTSKGLLVSQVFKGGNAEKSGVLGGTEAVRYGSRRNAEVIYLGGDILVEIDGISIATFADYYSVLESKKPGDKIEAAFLRGNRKISVELVLSASKQQ